MFNSKSEGRNFANIKRCLIRASAFFEFTGKASPKTKWRFALKGREIFGFYRADTLVMSIVWGGLSLVMMLSAARRADHPVRSYMYFRMVAVVLLCLDLVTAVATRTWASSEFWLIVLIAEYAATIRTIPPNLINKRRGSQPNAL